MRNVAPAPASAPAMNVSAAPASRFCMRATSCIKYRVWVKSNKLSPEKGASRATVLPSPENNPPAPSFRATFASVATKPCRAPAFAPAYSIRVFTTVIGFNNTAATVLAEHPAPNVIAERSNGVAFSLLKLAASSLVTRSSKKKYNPAPAVVRTHDALTPLQSPFIPFVLTTSAATFTIPRAPRSFSACIFVFTTSNGCNSALDTKPALAPPMKLAAGCFFFSALARADRGSPGAVFAA